MKKNENTLENFPAGAQVEYAVTAPGKILAQGHGKIDSRGRFKIPGPEKISSDILPVNYRVQVKEDNHDPFEFNLTLHPGEKGLSMKAAGLDEFSNIETKVPSLGTALNRSDWAGAFQKENAGDLSDIISDEGYQVAFLNTRMTDAVPEENPRIIKVQMEMIACAGPMPPLSICNQDELQKREEAMAEHITKSMQGAARQLSAAMMQQAAAFGMFLDAKQQLETQQLFQRMTAATYKDYQPSQQMCEIGTFMRSLPKAEEKFNIDKAAINRGLMMDYTNRKESSTAFGAEKDMNATIEQFSKNYCNPDDNYANLSVMCDSASIKLKPERKNRDIDYASLVGAPLTINADFSAALPAGTKDAVKQAEQDTEEDIFALGRNLYWPTAMDPALAHAIENNSNNFTNARSLFAMMNVAHNSFANIVGMKVKEPPAANGQGGASFMKALLKEFGLTADEINQMIGENPSYYAQMEILAKKIYQSPDFYTNLYDKPANVQRIGVSLDAIKLMQGRDLYELALRREMLTSLMLETELKPLAQKVNDSSP